MSSDRSAQFRSWLYLDTRWQEIGDPNGPRWPRLPSSPASRIRSTSRLRDLSRQSALGLFVMIGALYAICSLAAEWHYTAAWHAPSQQAALFHVKRAAAWFPLTGRYRSAPAYVYAMTRWNGSRVPGMIEIADALDSDPYDLDLRLALAAHLIEGGHQAEAAAQVAFVHAVAPRSKIAVKVHALP